MKKHAGSIRTHFAMKAHCILSVFLSKGGKASRISCASHVGCTSACTLASVLLHSPAAKSLGTTKTTAVHVVLECATQPSPPSAAPSQRNGVTHDMSRTAFATSRVMRCLFVWSRGGCEADCVTEAGDYKHAYHQLQ